MCRSVAAMMGISVVMVLIALNQTVVGTFLPQSLAQIGSNDSF